MRAVALAFAPLLVLVVLTSAGASARLPITAARDWWPVWSPNGRDIAFTRINGTGRVLQLEVLHFYKHRVTTIGANAGQLSPSWSPDSTKLVYSSGGILYVVNRDGTEKHRYFAPTEAYAPAWGKHSQIAYLTTHGGTRTDLWVDDEQWAPNAIGRPSWSPDGTTLAFQRDDGIYLATSRESQRLLASVANPGAPVWSHDGARIAYTALGRPGVFVVDVATGNVTQVITPQRPGPPAFSRDDRQVELGVAFSPVSDAVVLPGARPACPGHQVLEEGGRALTGSCEIVGTARDDVIEGTPLWGDVILAGAGNDRIHANDGHTDRVNCGAGHDTVWADRSDRLIGCEVVHR